MFNSENEIRPPQNTKEKIFSGNKPNESNPGQQVISYRVEDVDAVLLENSDLSESDINQLTLVDREAILGRANKIMLENEIEEGIGTAISIDSVFIGDQFVCLQVDFWKHVSEMICGRPMR